MQFLHNNWLLLDKSKIVLIQVATFNLWITGYMGKDNYYIYLKLTLCPIQCYNWNMSIVHDDLLIKLFHNITMYTYIMHKVTCTTDQHLTSDKADHPHSYVANHYSLNFLYNLLIICTITVELWYMFVSAKVSYDTLVVYNYMVTKFQN